MKWYGMQWYGMGQDGASSACPKFPHPKKNIPTDRGPSTHRHFSRPS